MRNQLRSIPHLVVLAVLLGGPALHGQGTAFTYQGRLQEGTNLATGSYDLAFGVWNDAVGGAQVGATVTNSATRVTNGLFTVVLDFGAGVFDGTARWLEINVRPNGNGAFSTLSPRQALTATPYAIRAGSVDAAGISGPISPANIPSGTITSNMLASGAAAANLAASGQSSVPGGAMVLSGSPIATNLTGLGYVRVGGQLDLCWQERRSEVVRTDPVGVWTGSKVLIWGGLDTQAMPIRSGGGYDPAANSWLAMAISNSPSARHGQSATWTGSRMILWGGSSSSSFFDDGALYDPANNCWLATTSSNAPEKRAGHTAVWTGSEMIVWGGRSSAGFGSGVWDLDNGARYNPTNDTWTSLSTNGSPSARFGHIAVWSGSEMIIWGGFESKNRSFLNDGARYNPATDTWTTMASVGAPSGRLGHTAVWTGSELIIWGGQEHYNPNVFSNVGKRYNPLTDTWSPVSLVDAPSARAYHTAVWTGHEMVVWGGAEVSRDVQTGGRYDPVTDTWLATSTTGGPGARRGHLAMWTGNEMLIFCGYGGPVTTYWDDTFSYTPSRVVYLYLRP